MTQKLIKNCPYTFKILSVVLILGVTASSQNTTKCPFQYLYHFGDGVTDIGNSVKVLPVGPFLPAARSPYGITFPGTPTGRWSDGLIDFDFAARDFGLPNIVPYLGLRNSSSSNDGVIFSVARSPVLDRLFLLSRGILVPSYAIPLSRQISWFKTYLRSVSSNPTDGANRLANSAIFLGDVEANDIGYALTQGKSIQQVQTYVPSIIKSQINAARELIRLGSTRIFYAGSGPIGCYPYILTALPSSSSAYDNLGCLKSVNDLILSKNEAFQQAITNLSMEFPNLNIQYADYFQAAVSVINQTSTSGTGGNVALKACCGIGGKYNYNEKRFCGSPRVPVCLNPSKYIFWDGLHLTQETQRRIEKILIEPALPVLNCTSQ
ncbi:hypothetical protein ACS0TY_027320 [Phlomoides rotata]